MEQYSAPKCTAMKHPNGTKHRAKASRTTHCPPPTSPASHTRHGATQSLRMLQMHQRLAANSRRMGLEPTGLSIRSERHLPRLAHPTQRQRGSVEAVEHSQALASAAPQRLQSALVAQLQQLEPLSRGLSVVVVVVGTWFRSTRANPLYLTNQTSHPRPTHIILMSAPRRVR